MKTIMFLFVMLIVSNGLFAQYTSSSAQHEGQMTLPKHGALLDGKTIVKVNLLGMPLRNFSFYGERIITKRMSAVLGANTMSSGQLPFIKHFTDDPGLLNMQVGSTSYSPEIRFYLGKNGYGQGFYIAPYYKFEKFNITSLAVNVKYAIGEFPGFAPFDDTLHIKGDFATHGFGALIGVQWLMGKKKNIVLDWTILGAHYGFNKATAEGHFDSAPEILIKDAVDQINRELIDELGDYITINKLEADGKKVFLDANSLWTMIRMSLSIGFRF